MLRLIALAGKKQMRVVYDESAIIATGVAPTRQISYAGAMQGFHERYDIVAFSRLFIRAF